MMNTMVIKSPNHVYPIPRRNKEVENEEVENEEVEIEEVDTVDNGIIYPPEYSAAQPIQIFDPYSIPLAPAVLIEEQHIHNAEEGRLPNNNEEEPKSKNKMTKAGFDPFQPIHPQCNHISYGCLTMAFLVFVGCAVLVNMYLPDIKAPSSVHKGTTGEGKNSTYPSLSPSFVPTVKSSNLPSLYPSLDYEAQMSSNPSSNPSFNPCSIQQFIGQSFEAQTNGFYTYKIDNLGNTGSEFKQWYSNSGYYSVGTFQTFDGDHKAIYTNGDLTHCEKQRSGTFEIELTDDPTQNGVMTTSEPNTCVYRFVRKCYSPNVVPTVESPNQPSPSNTKYYETKKLVASDGEALVEFGTSCSLSKDLVVIGAPGGNDKDNYKGAGAAYLFDVNGNLIKKLTPVGYGKADDDFGWTVSMDEKIVVGSNGKFVQVFSCDGEYERTLTCDEATLFGNDVATRGNLIVVDGRQNSIWKLFIFTTEGKLLKTLDAGSNTIWDVEISEQFIVSTSEGGTTIVYSNQAPNFPKITEIEQGGTEIALSGDKLVIVKYTQNDDDGAAWLYSTDGTLIKELNRQDSTSGSLFGGSVAITDDKILVGAEADDDGSINAGSVFIYSSATGDFQEKVLAPDAQAYDVFGGCVSASESLYVVGAYGVDDNGDRSGAAYLLPFSD